MSAVAATAAAPTSEPNPVPSSDAWRVANAAWLADGLRLLRLRLHRHALRLRRPGAAAAAPVEDWLLAGDDVGGAVPPATPLDGRIDIEAERLAASEAALRATGAPPALRVLADAVGLTGFEADVLLLAAAPSLDGAFGPAYAELHGDTRRDHATLHLALSVFAPVSERLLAADCLLPARPLRRLRLLHGLDETAEDGLLAPLVIDRRMTDYLRGVNRLDGRLDSMAVVLPAGPAVDTIDGARAGLLERTIGQRLSADSSRWPAVNLVGAADSDAETAVARAAAGLGLRVARLDLAAIVGLEPERRWDVLGLLGREAVLADLAVLVDASTASPRSTDAAVVDSIVRRLDAPLVLVSPERWPAGDVLLDVISVGRPTRVEQRSLWQTALARVPNAVNGELDDIVEQFDFGPGAIREVVARAARDGGEAITGDDLWDACRVQVGPALDELASRIVPAWGWDDIVVGDDVRAQLRELSDQVAHRARVYETWGFGTRLGRGRGITALFAGPTGTGKTMAAEIIAGQLRLDLYRVDLAGVVSKYVGETEKNLRRVFDAAESSGAILLFDEADALFGTRTEVRDSHDRYANLEINYLLQRMEDYAGLAILATNRRAALDAAFLRRLRFIIDFPFPDADDRQRIWARVFPAAADHDALDLGTLARLELSGGNIRSIAVNAAFLAAADRESIRMSHVMRAAAREYTKLGRPISTADFGDWSTVARP